MRIGIFIDGPYMYQTSKRMGWNVDHRRVLTQFSTPEQLYNAFYYAPVTNPDDERQQRFIDALVFMGYTVRSRYTPNREPRFEALIATDLLTTAPRWDRAVLASGSGELSHTLSVLRGMGKEIHLLGIPELVDMELRNLADRFLDLREWREALERQGGVRRVYPYPTLSETVEEATPEANSEG